MLALPGGGWIVDTPGIRSFGLAHVEPDHLIEAFPDLHELTEDCPRGCTHAADEPECGLDEAHRRRRRSGSSRSAGCSPPARRPSSTAPRLSPRRPGRRRHR